LVAMFCLPYLQIWLKGRGTTHPQLMKWQEWFASYPPSLKLWCVLYNCFPMFILLLLAPNVFMFDHYSPLRLEKYHKFLQGKQLCNPCLTLVVSNHLEIYLLMLFPFENSSSCIDLRIDESIFVWPWNCQGHQSWLQERGILSCLTLWVGWWK
jgi:hypothetical protein